MSGYQPVHLAYDAFEPISGVEENLSPIVFCHGVSADRENWKDIPQNIANSTKRKAYAIDARNHGDSEWSDIFNFDIIPDDLIHFLETKGISKAILVGHSMGGITVIKTALKRPDMVDMVVVEDMFVKMVPKSILDACVSYFSLARKAIADLPADLHDEDSPDSVKKFVMESIRSNLPQEIQDLKENDRETEDDHIAKFKKDENGRWVFKSNLEVIEKAMSNETTIMSESVGQFDGPACFIYGQLSPFKIAEEADNIKQFFPHATFTCIDGATHTVHADKPIEFVDAVLAFIS